MLPTTSGVTAELLPQGSPTASTSCSHSEIEVNDGSKISNAAAASQLDSFRLAWQMRQPCRRQQASEGASASQQRGGA